MFTIYEARKILTMSQSRRIATHVAVRDNLVLGAGTLDELACWGEHRLDRTFADKILMPGLVEGHSHMTEGAQWRFVYSGYFDRLGPDGTIWAGQKSIEAVLTRLREADAQTCASGQPLTAWGIDPVYFDGKPITRQALDSISSTRPIGILHISSHLMYVNSKALELAGMLRPGLNHPGVAVGDDGLPTGELKGPDAMTPVGGHVGLDRSVMAADEGGLRAFSKLCVRQGVTTAGDFANLLPPKAVEMMLRVTSEPTFPVRLVSLRIARDISPALLIDRVLELQRLSAENLRLGKIKIVLDGSIQGFSARIKAPGFFNGAANGLWYIAPEQLREIMERALAAGVQVHCHANGDEATDLALDMFELALRKNPVSDHRFTLQHCQLASDSQFKRMHALGLCVNLFSNHLYYWGDQHYALTVGPERAERMNACATALANGVPMAIHSDAPVTQLGPLFTAWCAVNRKTATGRVLGEAERISVGNALQAITLGAAYTLGLDGELGSIEAGKKADFAVLENDPTEIGGERLKDIHVWGTVQGGRLFEAASI